METLSEKNKETAVSLYNPTPTTKAVVIRQEMTKVPEVVKSLTDIEKYVFVASTKTPIAEIDDPTLCSKTRQMFRFIAMDVGYVIPSNADDWAYIQTRLLDILKRYYKQLTLSEIKLAFELAATGGLDEYLPKDSQGAPDRKHYQQFNAEYFSKILNAYKKKRCDVMQKAYKALPMEAARVTEEERKHYHNEAMKNNREIFLRYKYTGRLSFTPGGEILFFNWLKRIGYAEPLNVTEEDKTEAYRKYMQRVARGIDNRYQACHVQKKGAKSPELNFTSYEIARGKEIKRALDRMIEDEIFIDNLITFE